MTGSASRVPYGEMVAALRELCAAGSTGTLFIVTDDNHSVRVGLDRGKIMTLVAGDSCNEAAIPVFQAIKKGSYRFQDGLILDRRAGDTPADSERLFKALVGEAVAPGPPPTPRDDTLTKALEIIESEALGIIGPIARVLCAEHCAEVRDLPSLQQAIERIAVEIDDPERAEELRRRVMERLG